MTMIDVATLQPYERNPRTHSEEQIAVIAQSIEKFGFTNPILIDGERNIIAGHGRLAAAIRLGMERVPCVDLHGMTPAEKRAYIIADNQLAQQAGWDQALLRAELQDIIASNEVAIGVLGFSDEELKALAISADGVGLPELSSAGRVPIQTMTFILSDRQVETVRKAIGFALGMGDFPDEDNENRNGNALNRICEMFNGEIEPPDDDSQSTAG